MSDEAISSLGWGLLLEDRNDETIEGKSTDREIPRSVF